MELNQAIQSLRQAKLDEREAAAVVADKKALAQYKWWQQGIWFGVEILRYAWLNIYPLLALLVGVVFVFYVKQTREILTDLQQQRLTAAVLAAWAASIWYSMRVLSSTDYPGDADPHPAAKAIMPWLYGQAPRLAPFAGLAVIACSSSIFLTDNPGPSWIAPLAVGVVVVTWAAAWVCDGVIGLVSPPLEPTRVYRWSTLVIAIGAGLIASISWSTVPQPMRDAPQPLHLEDWLLWLCVALILIPLLVRRRGRLAQWSMAASFAIWLWIVYKTVQSHPGAPRMPFLILAFAGFGLWFTLRRRELFAITQQAAKPEVEVGRSTFVALGVALFLQLVMVIALTLSPITIGMWIGTLGLLFLGLALLPFFGIVWVFVPKYLTLPSLALVPLIWGIPLGNQPDYLLRDSWFAHQAPERPQLAHHFEQWRAQLPKPDQSPVFFVAAAGGGLRAAYWTATMLAAADDHTCGEFGRHVYAYSGVSGGSLGIAAYLAQRQVWEAKSPPPSERCQTGRRQEMADLLRRDFLAPVAGSMLFAELTQRYVPFDYLKEDRGSILARAWSKAWDDVFPADKGRFDRPFLDVFAGVKDGRPGPAVFLNATAVETGRRAIATNVRVAFPASIDIFRPVQKAALKTDGLPLREAVLNSARFTYVSPAGTVHSCAKPAENGTCAVEAKLWDRLVDGGYFENSGVATLTDVMRALAARAKTPGKDRMFVIVIDNSNESELACRKGRAPESDGNDSLQAGLAPLSGVTAPIEALLHVREARGQLEVRRLRMDFSCAEGRLVDWNLFGDQADRSAAQAAGQEPALGWFLSRRSAQWIGQRANEVAQDFPFRHAACHTGKPAGPVRAVVGDPAQPNVVCIEPTKSLKP